MQSSVVTDASKQKKRKGTNLPPRSLSLPFDDPRDRRVKSRVLFRIVFRKGFEFDALVIYRLTQDVIDPHLDLIALNSYEEVLIGGRWCFAKGSLQYAGQIA